MNEHESVETSAVLTEEHTEEHGLSERLLSEAEALKAVYPDFDLEAELAHPLLGALLRGEAAPTLRQLYEAVHLEDIAAGRVESAVEAAVAHTLETAVPAAVDTAVSEAVRESEERLLGNIRARGQRPVENGIRAAAGIRMHPAAGRLTRRERALLAKRAENGETIKF